MDSYKSYMFFPEMEVSLNSIYDDDPANCGTAKATVWMKANDSDTFIDITDTSAGDIEYVHEPGETSWHPGSLHTNAVTVPSDQSTVTIRVQIDYTNKNGVSGTVSKTYEIYVNNLMTLSGTEPLTQADSTVTFHYILNDAVKSFDSFVPEYGYLNAENTDDSSNNQMLYNYTYDLDIDNGILDITFDGLAYPDDPYIFTMVMYYNIIDPANEIEYTYSQEDTDTLSP